MMESSPRRSFTWPRGEGECWSIAPRFGELVLLYAGGWPAFEREYHPLAEEPRLFEELAALGLAAKEAGGRLAAEGSDLVRLGRLSKSGEFIVDEEGRGDEDRDSLAAHAAEDSTIQQQVLSFVNVYGPLDFGPRERGRGRGSTRLDLERGDRASRRRGPREGCASRRARRRAGGDAWAPAVRARADAQRASRGHTARAAS